MPWSRTSRRSRWRTSSTCRPLEKPLKFFRRSAALRPARALFAPSRSPAKQQEIRWFSGFLLGCALVFLYPIRFHCWPPASHRFFECAHAIVAVLSAHPERESERGRDRVASPDAARRHDAAGGGGHLCLAAAGLKGAEEDRADRPRGAEPGRRHRTLDADAATGGPVARKRPLRCLRSGNAADHRPAQARVAVWSDQ